MGMNLLFTDLQEKFKIIGKKINMEIKSLSSWEYLKLENE
jgi:hypothetical protein